MFLLSVPNVVSLSMSNLPALFGHRGMKANIQKKKLLIDARPCQRKASFFAIYTRSRDTYTTHTERERDYNVPFKVMFQGRKGDFSSSNFVTFSC
jgi:hypothetical protein